MDLQYIERYALQLKNVPRTLIEVASVVQKIMKTLYDAHFPDAENRRPGRNPEFPTATFLRSDGCLNTLKTAKTPGIQSSTENPFFRLYQAVAFQSQET